MISAPGGPDPAVPNPDPRALAYVSALSELFERFDRVRGGKSKESEAQAAERHTLGAMMLSTFALLVPDAADKVPPATAARIPERLLDRLRSEERTSLGAMIEAAIKIYDDRSLSEADLAHVRHFIQTAATIVSGSS